MIKTILVPTSGSSTDHSVFGTALALARPPAAHIEFLHVHLTPGMAALHTPHVDFLRGAAVSSALTALGREEDDLSAHALAHFKEFCREHRVLIRDAPKPVELVSARYSEQVDQPLARRRSSWRCAPRSCTPNCWWSAPTGTDRCASGCSAASPARCSSTPGCRYSCRSEGESWPRDAR